MNTFSQCTHQAGLFAVSQPIGIVLISSAFRHAVKRANFFFFKNIFIPKTILSHKVKLFGIALGPGLMGQKLHQVVSLEMDDVRSALCFS